MIKKYCINCHTLYDTGEETCPNCGFKVSDVKFVMQDGEKLTVSEYAMCVDLLNKEIEEMAKDFCPIVYPSQCQYQCVNIGNCQELKEACQKIYNLGYRKVDKIEKMKFYREAYEQGKFDANAEIAVGEKVVVSRAEYEALQSDLINTEMNLQHITKEYEQTRKETAREILQELSKMRPYGTKGDFLYKIDKLAEKYGVEVE